MTQDIKKLYVSISAGEETYYFTKAEGLRLLSEEFDRIERENGEKEWGYEWDWHWMTEEDYKDVSGSPDKPTFEPLPIPSSIEEEAARRYPVQIEHVPISDYGHTAEIDNNYEARQAFIAGSQLRPDTSRLRKALEKIANPLRYLQEEAKVQGAKLDGQMAIQLSNDANWLKQLAEEELKVLNTSGEEKQDELWREVINEIETAEFVAKKYDLVIDAIMERYHISKK